MKQSKLFGKTRKDISKDEKSINAELLIKAGYIEKHMAGVYNYLPLGLRVFRKVENIIRNEMDAVDGQEMLMTALQPKELWEKTGRWQEMNDIMYQFEDGHGSEVGLATTHEEVVTELAKQQIKSYKDLPIYIYQIQDKFRNEKRAKSGLLRGREFSMKDLYSFHTDEKDLDDYYFRVHDAYLNIFKDLGLEAFSVEASGGSMSKQFSHEFMVITEAGEDVTVLCKKCGWAQNKEIAKQKAGDTCPKCGAKLQEAKTVEAGNIFRLGTKYSESLNLQYADENGQMKDVLMGSYGIGLGRVMGTVVEASHDKNGIIWTKSTTPYHVHLLNLAKNDKKLEEADKLYQELKKAGFEVLYDDRDISFGKKLKDADLIGICKQLIISDKQDKLEFNDRKSQATDYLDLPAVIKQLKEFYK
jgi:prolyl-tRNA synthetase